jgi:hypothetical protein
MKKVMFIFSFLVIFCLTTYNSISDYAIAYPYGGTWVDPSGLSQPTSMRGRLIGLTITWYDELLRTATNITAVCDEAYPTELCWWLSDGNTRFNYGTIYGPSGTVDPTVTTQFHVHN